MGDLGSLLSQPVFVLTMLGATAYIGALRQHQTGFDPHGLDLPRKELMLGATACIGALQQPDPLHVQMSIAYMCMLT